MKIKCPHCGETTEIEHVDTGAIAECLCGKTFVINEKTTLEAFTEIDSQLPAYIAQYPVTGLLGYGGMGKVYLGRHPALNIPVAIKALRMEYMTDRASCDRFVQSAKICARLNHPNIVRIYDCGYFEDNVFLIMEYISGGSAQTLLEQEKKLTSDHAALIMMEVCSGLMEAAKFGIVHRDIKPDNIMFDEEGNVKILDLGLSKISGDKRLNKKTITASLTSLGTPQYMAPEQALDASLCDSRADVYSIGITLYQFCTGVLPFDSRDTSELRRMHAQDTPKPPSELEPELSREMEYIILKCIEKNRDNRYADIMELALDLEAFLKNRILPSTMNAKKIIHSDFVRKEKTFFSRTGISPLSVFILGFIICIAGILTFLFCWFSFFRRNSEFLDIQQKTATETEILSQLQKKADKFLECSDFENAANIYLNYQGTLAKETLARRKTIGEGLLVSAAYYKKLKSNGLNEASIKLTPEVPDKDSVRNP